MKKTLFLCVVILSLTFYSFESSEVEASSELFQGIGQPKGFAVLELFTSQGCSSCPPADRYLKEIAAAAEAKNLPVYPLSFHVDYWNYMGWQDPYSGNKATDRQRSYARAFSK